MIKKFTMILLVFLLTNLFAIQAQNVFFTTNYTEYAPWDEEAQDFVDFNGQDQETTFELFEDLSQFIHTTETMQSTYTVNENNYDENTETYEFDVTSDVGNNYQFIIDLNDKKLKVIGIDDDGSAYMVLFHVSDSWTEGDR